MVSSLARHASPGGVVVQRYNRTTKKGQGGYFIMGNEQVHLHLGINRRDHLKIEGEFCNIAVGTTWDPARMRTALDKLLTFRDSIANDTVKARNYAAAIQDCIDWFKDNGVVPPEPVPTPVASGGGGGGKEEKKDPDDTGGGYGDFFSAENMSRNQPVDEDDFM